MTRSLDEDEKKATLAKRVANLKLSKKIIQGTAYRESVEVKGVDGQTYDVLVRPLGEGEIMEAYRSAGVSFSELGDEDEAKKKLEEVILVQHNLIAKSATGDNGETWTAQEVGALIKFGESFPLARRILELSGLIGKEVESLKAFREGTRQPEP